MAEDDRVMGGSIGKSIKLLEKFIDGQDAWGVRELAGAIDQPASSVHRVLRIMSSYGLLEWEPLTQKYRTGPELHRWASILRSRLKLPALVRPVAQSLVGEVNESVWYAVYDARAGRVWYTLEVECSHLLRYPAPIGRQESLTESAAGLAILALQDDRTRRDTIGESPRLAEIEALVAEFQRQGAIVDVSGSGENPVMIAAPVTGAGGDPLGALVMPVPVHRFDSARAADVIRSLVAAAGRISSVLGGRVLTGSEEATSYRGIAAAASIIKESLGSLQLTPWESGGSLKLNELEKNRAAYGTAVAADVEAAYLGEAPFDHPHSNLRLAIGLAPLQLHVLVREELVASTLPDLKDLRVSPGEMDYSTARTFLKLMGWPEPPQNTGKRKRGQISYLGYREANRLFESGRLDALVSFNTAPNPAYVNLARKTGFRLLSLEDDRIDAFLKSNPRFVATTMPAGTYPGQTTDVKTIAAPFVIVTTTARSAVEVHDLVASIHHRQQDLAAASPSFGKLMSREELAKINVPLHPGTERFFGIS